MNINENYSLQDWHGAEDSWARLSSCCPSLATSGTGSVPLLVRLKPHCMACQTGLEHTCFVKNPLGNEIVNSCGIFTSSKLPH